MKERRFLIVGGRVSIACMMAWALAGAASPVIAAEVSARLSTRETYAGVPVSLSVVIVNAAQHESPVIPEIPDVTIRSLGEPGRTVQTTSINGDFTQNITLTYNYLITAQKPGKITIPPIKVRADEQDYMTEPLTLIISKSDTNDLLLVEVIGAKNTLYVGESLEVTLQIWMRPYQDKRYNFTLREEHMWSLINLQNSEWGLFIKPLQEMLNRRERPVGHDRIRTDSAGNQRMYYLYELRTTIWPDQAGTLNPGDISILASYPTALDRSMDLFSGGGLTISRSRPVSAQVKVEPITVKALPTEGRPAGFRGAVGQYQITTTAKPTEVAVGDPITLTMSITGSGQLETLQAPSLTEIEELTRDFKVPNETLAGAVEKNAKQFTQSIRATSDQVSSIPPIPLVYFDPQQEKFITVKSAPIPLKVKPADMLAMSHIVDAGRPASTALTQRASGIIGNELESSLILSQQTVAPRVFTFLLLTIPPVVWIVCWNLRRRTDRLSGDISYARRLRARRNALHLLEQDGHANVATIAAAVSNYVADKCNHPTGGLTRASVVEQLKQTNIRMELIEQVDLLLQHCEQQQYAGDTGQVDTALAQTARRCIDQLERECWP